MMKGMTELTQDLTERLVRQFTAAILAKLQPDEAAFFAEVEPPSITVASIDGEPAIKIRLFGQETLIEWDGTEADAVQCVLHNVDSAADNISDGYWATGGWRTRTSSPPSE